MYSSVSLFLSAIPHSLDKFSAIIPFDIDGTIEVPQYLWRKDKSKVLDRSRVLNWGYLRDEKYGNIPTIVFQLYVHVENRFNFLKLTIAIFIENGSIYQAKTSDFSFFHSYKGFQEVASKSMGVTTNLLSKLCGVAIVIIFALC